MVKWVMFMALYKDICYLGNMKEFKNKGGDVVKDILYYDTHEFVNVKSIGYREFYEAHASGYKPEIMLEMSSFSYNMQEYILFNNVVYKVIRTYQKGLDKIELTLQREVNQYKKGVKKIYLDGLFYLDGSQTLSGVL